MSYRAALFLPVFCLAAATFAAAEPTALDSWHQWRGPYNTGVAVGGAPTEFSEERNVKWRVPGRSPCRR